MHGVKYRNQSINMSNLSIEYIKPTSRALGRMTTILFRPFDIGKWFVLGFTAWLATLMDAGNSAGGNAQVGDSGESGNSAQSQSFEGLIEPARNFSQENLSWLIPVAVALIILVIVISLVCLWISSRGKFMLLDNVVHNRALVKAPWRQFRAAGNSLFWWRLLFGLLVLLVLGGIAGGAAFYLVPTFDAEVISSIWIAVLVISGLALILAVIVSTYVIMLLEDFVIPMMYRDALLTTEAWRQVLALHKNYPGQFVIYFLWKALLGVATLIILMTAFLITCCIAACFLAIPYIGAVLLLPVTVFYRSLGPEFLRQFGEEYDLWHGSEDRYGFATGTRPGIGTINGYE